MTRIPLAARLGPNDEKIDAHTTVERIQRHFPSTEIDWKRGDEEVYRGIERLRAMNAPDFYYEAKLKSLGKVAYICFRDERFPGRSAWFYASRIERDLGDCFDLYSAPETDIVFLKQLAGEIAAKCNFNYLLSTDATWGIGMRSEPQRLDPIDFARRRLPEHGYPELTIRPIDNWQASLRRAIPPWFEQATFKSKQAMIDRVGSVEVVATEIIAVVQTIDDVQSAWIVDVPAPFHNSLIVEHEGWMSFVSLSGAQKGILS